LELSLSQNSKGASLNASARERRQGRGNPCVQLWVGCREI